ncbi:amino acid adenylation domain-containing protein [Streptomyces sp. YIM 98790]|uniref:amino acid adenylation domain-containing protein n=1 Tax=Streptomyces sp. YIM 98790 TaxID=2689077 RepID=UPI00140D4850|nr:amino acid adenylation domain-containing protein [Streptomyces sp. YIM 98790]
MTDRTLYGWFAASAAVHGDRTALQIGGRRWTYRELAAHSDRTARLLLRRAGRAPRRIGLLASRSLLAYAGYLAVLRLGATVVPLNPAFPPGRNAAIARAAGVGLLLADGGEHPETPPGVPVFSPTEQELLAPAEDTGAVLPARPAGPDGLAYILFTSGSTGVPKGVPIRHRNVHAYLEHVVSRHGTGPGDRVSQAFDLTFDPSVYDMFTAWGSGATLVVPTRADLLAPVRFINRNRITHWNSVPSVISLALRMRALEPGGMPTLRRSLFCGEPLTLLQAGAWSRAAPGSVVENLYGPTEMTVTCAEYRLPADPGDWPRPANGTVPIGRVHPGLDHVVLDEGGRPARAGELCLRGPQRFPGYLDPADNAGRFLHFDGSTATGHDGRGPLTEEHWYRTGDRVTRHGNDLVHLGRTDHQVKVRGYRVELGEIEAVLREQPGVTDAVVLAGAGESGETELVAAYAGDGAAEEDLLCALAARLPGYMIPRRLAAFETLPRNENGKIDRVALRSALAGPGLR